MQRVRSGSSPRTVAAPDSMTPETRPYTNGIHQEPAVSCELRGAFTVVGLPEHLPQMDSCPWCANTVDRIDGERVAQEGIPYSFPLEEPLVHYRGLLPGYRCLSCEAELLTPLVSLLVESAALSQLERMGQQQAAMPLQASVARWRKLLDTPTR